MRRNFDRVLEISSTSKFSRVQFSGVDDDAVHFLAARQSQDFHTRRCSALFMGSYVSPCTCSIQLFMCLNSRCFSLPFLLSFKWLNLGGQVSKLMCVSDLESVGFFF